MAHLDTEMLGGVMKLLVFRHEEKSEIDKNNCTIIIRCKTNHKIILLISMLKMITIITAQATV